MRYLVFLGVFAMAGCVEDPLVERASSDPVDGATAFAADCAACHGADAKGGGVAASGLDVQPPDLTTIAARDDGTFPRDQVMSTIDGLDRGTHFSAAMPEFGAGDMGETIVVETDDGLGTPVPARLLALTDYLEALQE